MLLPVSMRLCLRKLKKCHQVSTRWSGCDCSKGTASVVSAALLANLNTKSWFSLRIEPYAEPCVPTGATTSEYSSQNTKSKYKRTQLKNWCGALCGQWKPPEGCNFLQWFWCYYMLRSISARSLCSGKFLANSMRMGEDISFKDSFPELCITEEPYDKLFCRAC